MNKLSYLISILVSMMIIVGSCQKEELTINDQDADHKKGKKPKVAIYHVTGNGSYQLIYVSENALPAHLAHGDILYEIDVTADVMAQNALDVLENPWKWYFYDDGPTDEGIDPTVGSFVSGPESPPAGTGSAQISVTGDQRYNIANSQWGGTPLADITSLAFSTYNPSAGNGGSATRSGYLHFNVSFYGGPLFQSRLIYVPRDNGDVDQDTWQEWDALDGGNTMWRWHRYATNTTPGPNTWPDGNGDVLRSWNDLLAAFPDIKMHALLPFIGVRVGEPYDNGYTENIDAFKIGINGFEQIFDFE